jgi:hypothetical protein
MRAVFEKNDFNLMEVFFDFKKTIVDLSDTELIIIYLPFLVVHDILLQNSFARRKYGHSHFSDKCLHSRS